MRVHTDILSSSDIWSALPAGVYADIAPHGSRARARAFEVALYVYEPDALHRRRRNTGMRGASGDYTRGHDSGDYSATWDEWGEWIYALLLKDPGVIFGAPSRPVYAGMADYLAATGAARNRIRAMRAPHTIEARTHTAPWIERHAAAIAAESCARAVRIAGDLAVARYAGDEDISVHEERTVHAVDSGYSVAADIFVDADTVDRTLAAVDTMMGDA